VKLVALVGGLGSSDAFCLAEEARRLHGTRFGECVLVDAGVDAATLLAMMDHYNAKELVLVFACPSCPEDAYSNVEPQEAGGLSGDPDAIVKTLWPNLTGSLDPTAYIEALRLLYQRGFKVYKLKPRRECREGVWLVIRRECQQAGEFIG
jgi:hypothetical protein